MESAAPVSAGSRGRPWIPPSGLLAGHIAYGASWCVLWLLAQDDDPSPMRVLSWIHLVALGWATLVALSVLLFVLPQFTDARWRGESWARAGIAVFAAGAYAMVIAFFQGAVSWLWIACAVAVGGILAWVIPAYVTLSTILPARKTEAAIARALATVFAFLGAAAIVGFAMARELAHGGGAGLANLARAHATLASIGWLTLLVMGVSARTIGPITGHRSPRRWVHVVSSTLVTAGAIGLAAGLWAGVNPAAWFAAICVGGLVIYSLDMLALVITSTVPHRPPQGFVAASIVWLLVACGLGLSFVAGDAGLAFAVVFTGLVGWIGQMLTAHLHHIGIRLIATTARGDDDETPPEALLHSRLSWISFALFQAAVGLGCISQLVQDAAILRLAAVSGLLGWVAMTANIVRAVALAYAPPGGAGTKRHSADTAPSA